MQSLGDFSEFLKVGKDGLDLLNAALGLMPKSDKRDELQARTKAAEEALRRSDAALAKAYNPKNPTQLWLTNRERGARSRPFKNEQIGRLGETIGALSYRLLNPPSSGGKPPSGPFSYVSRGLRLRLRETGPHSPGPSLSSPEERTPPRSSSKE